MSQTKSILLQLPLQKRLQFKEAVRKQALSDKDKRGFQERFKDIDTYVYLPSVLVRLLSWGRSKQGYDYWEGIYVASSKIIK